MIYAALYIILLAVVLDRTRALAISTKVFRSQRRLLQIREHLREGAIKGEVDPRHWVYNVLDGTITKTSGALEGLTLWRLLGHHLAVNRGSHAAWAMLERELGKPGNEYFRRVYVMYQAVLTIHLIDRSPIIRVIIKCLLGLSRLRVFIAEQYKKVGMFAASAPETSTLSEFAPAAG